MTTTLCGPCGHPMHWRECGADANLTGSCSCRNDESILPMHYPDESPATPNGAKGAKPRPMPTPEKSRMGRTSRTRGNAKERAWCHRLGLRHTGQYGGKADGEDALFIGQCKSRKTGSFPGWMSDELDKLAALRTGRTPILGVVEAPGVGRRERRLVVIDEADWIALHVGDGAA